MLPNECSNAGCYAGYFFNGQYTSTSDQCLICLPPCALCFTDGSCLLCQSPYSQVFLTQGSPCFLCYDPRCTNCSNGNLGSCTTCSAGFNVINGTCQPVSCGAGCTQCSSATTCQFCMSYYFKNSSNVCQLCPGAPICFICSNNSVC